MTLPVHRFVAIQVLLALVPAVFSAPFLHLHGHEDRQHFAMAHRAQTLGSHTHFPTCQCGVGHSGSVVITAAVDDDDAVFLNWFQNNPHPAPSLEFVLVEARLIAPPEPIAASTAVPTPRSHDPPLVFALNPRSPPALPASVGV